MLDSAAEKRSPMQTTRKRSIKETRGEKIWLTNPYLNRMCF